jgi:crotonobetainyl-CoA:carnitine CoA-transferase CaiB-like acyl-CoA transferase
MWVNFCKLIGKDEWIDDPRFESNPGRVENRKALLPLLDEVMAQKTCDEWMELLVETAIPCGPVNDMQHLFADEQLQHREMIAEVAHPTIGTLRLGGIPIKYSETPPSVRLHPPLLGEHTDEVLQETLGYAPENIEALKRQGAVASA